MPATPANVAEIQPGAWRSLTRLWPIILFLGYLTATLVIFVFGPIPYPVTNPWTTYLYLLAAHAALLGGYLVVPFRISGARPAPGDAWMFSVPGLVAVSAVLNIGLLIPATLFMTNGSLDLVGALRDPAAAYTNAFAMSVNTTNPWSYPVMIAAPLLALTLPLTLFYWRELSLGYRVLAVAAILVSWASGAILGRYKTTADLLILGAVFLLAHTFRRAHPPRARRSLQVVAVVLIVTLVFVALFANTMLKRTAQADLTYAGIIDARVDFDNVLLSPFPEPVKPTMVLLCRYATQGYYGLSLAMRLDFVWTHGFGNSFFLHLLQERALGSEYARHNAYPARVEEEFGYLMLQRWHTIYPWLASDLTFGGALIFVALIGMLLAATWFETLAGVNPFSVSMFANLCVMLFYFNANNQGLAAPVQFSATVGTTALWLFTRYRLQSARDARG